MTAVAGVDPHFSATRAGGESVTITGTELGQVTSVSFGPFEGAIQHQTADALVVTAPDFRPGHGGNHGEVVVWVDTEPTHTGVVWTWEGKTLEQLGGPLDDVDQAVAFGSVAGPGAPRDAVDEAVQQPAGETGPAIPADKSAFVDSFSPAILPRRGGWITILGYGFTGATAVTVGDHPVQDFRVDSDNQVVALVPSYSRLGVSVDSTLPSYPYVWHGDQHSVSGLLPHVEWLLDPDSVNDSDPTITFGDTTEDEAPPA